MTTERRPDCYHKRLEITQTLVRVGIKSKLSYEAIVPFMFRGVLTGYMEEKMNADLNRYFKLILLEMIRTGKQDFRIRGIAALHSLRANPLRYVVVAENNQVQIQPADFRTALITGFKSTIDDVGIFALKPEFTSYTDTEKRVVYTWDQGTRQIITTAIKE